MDTTYSETAKTEQRKMALRGGVATACSIAKQRNVVCTVSPLFNFTCRQPFSPHPRFQSALRYPTFSNRGAATAEPVTSKDKNEGNSPESWKIKMLYDGDCPLCMREVNMLRERNRSYSTIKFVDISSDEYSPEENQGLDYKTIMGRIHAILSDGTVVTDVEAFRRLYEQVGLGWVYAITKYEPVSDVSNGIKIATIADAIYGVWAKYRLQITGRPPLEEVLEARRRRKVEACNDNNACKM